MVVTRRHALLARVPPALVLNSGQSIRRAERVYNTGYDASNDANAWEQPSRVTLERAHVRKSKEKAQ